MEITNGDRVTSLDRLCKAWVHLDATEKALRIPYAELEKITQEVGTDILGEVRTADSESIVLTDIATMRDGLARAISKVTAGLLAEPKGDIDAALRPTLNDIVGWRAAVASDFREFERYPARERCPEYGGNGIHCSLPAGHTVPCNFSAQPEPLYATNNPAVPRCTEFHDGIGVRCPLPYKHEGPCDFSERGALGACRGNFKGRYCGLPVAHEGAHEYFCGQLWTAGHCTFLLGHKGPCSTNQGHED